MGVAANGLRAHWRLSAFELSQGKSSLAYQLLLKTYTQEDGSIENRRHRPEPSTEHSLRMMRYLFALIPQQGITLESIHDAANGVSPQKLTHVYAGDLALIHDAAEDGAFLKEGTAEGDKNRASLRELHGEPFLRDLDLLTVPPDKESSASAKQSYKIATLQALSLAGLLVRSLDNIDNTICNGQDLFMGFEKIDPVNTPERLHNRLLRREELHKAIQTELHRRCKNLANPHAKDWLRHVIGKLDNRFRYGANLFRHHLPNMDGSVNQGKRRWPVRALAALGFVALPVTGKSPPPEP
jgi:hypothetical protein